MRYIEHASERTMRGNAIRNERKEIALSVEHFSSPLFFSLRLNVRLSEEGEEEENDEGLFQSRTITFSTDVSNVINDHFRLKLIIGTRSASNESRDSCH